VHRINAPVKLGVVVRVFANQVGTMRNPNPVVAHPRRHDKVAIVTLFHGVLVTPTNPLVNTYIHVMSKGRSIAFPHLECGMTAPALGCRAVSEDIVELHSLNTLFAETAIV
jgi:hypothetical protein